MNQGRKQILKVCIHTKTKTKQGHRQNHKESEPGDETDYKSIIITQSVACVNIQLIKVQYSQIQMQIQMSEGRKQIVKAQSSPKQQPSYLTLIEKAGFCLM